MSATFSVAYQNHACKHVSVNLNGHQTAWYKTFDAARASALALWAVLIQDHTASFKGMQETDGEPCLLCK